MYSLMKKELDKYYTPIEVANYCWEKADEIIGLENISEIIEPSCGNGSFCHWRRKPDVMIDLKPEIEGAKTADFLSYEIEYKENRLIIGNPPFGDKLKLARDFFNKSCSIADWIAFILPISQLNNTTSFYKFDLIHSEDLGLKNYSGVTLHCCLNIYKRPAGGIYGFQKKHFEGITFYRQDKKGYEDITDYDIRMCYWGNGSCGKILSDGEHYSGEYKIKVSDKHPQKKEILNILRTTDWNSFTKQIAMKRLKQYMIFNELKRQGIKEMRCK